MDILIGFVAGGFVAFLIMIFGFLPAVIHEFFIETDGNPTTVKSKQDIYEVTVKKLT